MIALDLFCGAGGAAMGLALAGFDVIGVDIKPQPRYPFRFIQADAMTYPLDADFIWASPPCQKYTNAQQIQGNDHPDYIGALRERLQGRPYVIENVVGAPLHDPIELCGSMFGLRTYRHRLFECSFKCRAPVHYKHKIKQAKMGRPVRQGEFIQVVGNFSDVTLARKAMGISWMTRNELRESIPPAYSEYVAEQYLLHR